MASKKVYGGANHFKWEEALTDKYRENYLGQTLAGSSRPTFNNPRPNAMWYLNDKDKSQQRSPAEDLAAVKEQENRIMLQMMGLLPKDPPRPAENKIDRQDLMKILAKDGNKDAFDEADRGSGLGFGSVARHSKDLIDQVKKTDATSKYEPAERQEERSTRFYDRQDDERAISSRGRGSASDSTAERERSTASSAAEKEKHKHKDKHKSKDKERHKHKDKDKHKEKEKSKKKRSRSRSRSQSPKSKGRHQRDGYEQRRESYDDRRSHSERSREGREERRHSPEARRSRLTPSPKRRRMDTPSPPARRADDRDRRSRDESSPHRRRLDTLSPSPPRRRRMDTPSPSPRHG